MPLFKKWIDENIDGKSCLIVLIGEKTADENGLNMKSRKLGIQIKALLV
jgi:hypothetical protein